MSTLRNFFWVLALGVIASYLFFLALGAFSADEVLPVTIVVAVLAIMWAVHATLERRHAQHQRDKLLIQARERRGF